MLGYNKIGDEGALLLAKAIENNKYLETIKLGKT